MICTFCGSENRAENRFCGMCGVRLERRTAERRVSQMGSLRCPSCSHVNDPGYRFCSMCGTRIERRVQDRRGADDQIRATALANAQLPPPESSRLKTALPREPEIPPAPDVPAKAASVASVLSRGRTQSGTIYMNPEKITSSTSIGGPSFLGLNSEPLSEGEYLLEDDSSSRGGLRTLVLLAILAAILGLIFVQWRSSYRANPRPQPAKPAPSDYQPQGDNRPPAKPATPGTAQNSNPPQSSATKNPDTAPKQNVSETQNDRTAEAASDAAKENKSASSVNGKSSAAAENDDEESGDVKQAVGGDSKTIPPEKQRPSAALIRAQQYLQGRGVRQSCEQGLMYLKAATEQNDPRAAVQMAALYSSGHCVEQNRVKAYQWFSSAHELDPSNTWIEKNLNQLWARMSPEERRHVQN